MINDGDILLFKNARGLSKLIVWGTRSPYSHVAVCVSKNRKKEEPHTASGSEPDREETFSFNLMYSDGYIDLASRFN